MLTGPVAACLLRRRPKARPALGNGAALSGLLSGLHARVLGSFVPAMDPKAQPFVIGGGGQAAGPAQAMERAGCLGRSGRRRLCIGAALVLALATGAILAGVLTKVVADKQHSEPAPEGAQAAGAPGGSAGAAAATSPSGSGNSSEAGVDDKDAFLYENQQVQEDSIYLPLSGGELLVGAQSGQGVPFVWAYPGPCRSLRQVRGRVGGGIESSPAE